MILLTSIITSNKLYYNTRFQVEDVEESRPQSIHGELASPSAAEATITSMDYHTSEAIPTTLYYRDQGEDKGMLRPSLDALRSANEHIKSRQHSEEVYIL